MNQKFIHLTNFSINKKNTAKFVKNNDDSDSDELYWLNFNHLGVEKSGKLRRE